LAKLSASADVTADRFHALALVRRIFRLLALPAFPIVTIHIRRRPWEFCYHNLYALMP